MRNRAKCKLCGDVIESFLKVDYVTCRCSEISIDGGSYYLYAAARDWNNFIRIADDDSEVAVRVVDKDHIDDGSTTMIEPRISRKDLLEMFEEMTNRLDQLPQHVKQMSPTNADLYSFMLVLSQLLRDESK